MKTSSQEQLARAFATGAHGAIDHRRKYTNVPYISHPEAVVGYLKTIPNCENMLVAAWIHDVVEDTHCSIELVKEFFGEEVASLVEMLTDVSKPGDGTRAVRKQIDREHTAKANSKAKTIKLADLIDNAQSIFEHDKKFAKVYFSEMNLLLGVLTEGHPVLWATARKICDFALAELAKK